jgi:hypothetical protein
VEQLTFQFLIACHESVTRRRPLLVDVAASVNVSRDQHRTAAARRLGSRTDAAMTYRDRVRQKLDPSDGTVLARRALQSTAREA